MLNLFGLPGIFDNVRDGLVLVRFPEGKIVLFNRAAAEMCAMPSSAALGLEFGGIFTDPLVQQRARTSSAQAVGEWPGHAQAEFRTTIRGPAANVCDIELHICRVEDAGTGGPLVLLVMRPAPENVLAATLVEVAKAQQSRGLR